jgi:hypothetical protein
VNQCRLPPITKCEHFSQRSTCAPSAAVRQRSIADITFNLVEVHTVGIGLAPRRTMAAEDIRDLQRQARHARRGSGGQRGLRLGALGQQWSDAIQRARHLAQRIGATRV